MLRRKKRVALALGAGGSRGLAHIGVIRALKDSLIPIDCIAGISFGAIIGALYSLYQDIDEESEIHHSLDVVFRSFDISQEFMNIYLAKELDCLIRPAIGSYPWSDFDHFDLFVEEGYFSAKDKIAEIRRRIFWF
ncbi:MAG: patatin-like phospholipase family protein [Desulfomonilia bacterium]|jgi:predicted acylesterase/phospholipase RssA